MTAAKRTLGAQGETAARRWLEGRGYDFVAANVRTPYGELDLVMRHKDTLRFVEVKARRSFAQGQPQEAVGPRKLKHLTRAASCYVRENQLTSAWQLDVIAWQAGAEQPLAFLENVSGL